MVTDGRWRLILPRTFEAQGTLKAIPPDNYLRPYLIAALEAAQPMLYDLDADPKKRPTSPISIRRLLPLFALNSMPIGCQGPTSNENLMVLRWNAFDGTVFSSSNFRGTSSQNVETTRPSLHAERDLNR